MVIGVCPGVGVASGTPGDDVTVGAGVDVDDGLDVASDSPHATVSSATETRVTSQYEDVRMPAYDTRPTRRVAPRCPCV